MNYYFHLQYKRLYRLINENGLNPYLVFVLGVFLFVVISEQLYSKIEYAPFMYPVFAVVFVNSLGNKHRNDFLKNCFSLLIYRRIRFVENVLIVAPFVMFLIYKMQFITALLILFFALGLSFFNKDFNLWITMPTPFSKKPFEFTVGFRKSYPIIALVYLLTYFSIIKGNFYIGAFSLVAVFLISLSFYSKPEPPFYVWVHRGTPLHFLKEKMKISLRYSFGISLPIMISLLVFYPENGLTLIGIECVGFLFVIAALLGKYAYFPTEINIIPGFAIAMGVIFPPFLLFILPFFYLKARKNLEFLLK